LYTRNPANRTSDNEEQISGEEYANITEKELGRYFTDKETIIHWYLNSGDYKKLNALTFLYKYILDNGYKNILSLGAGPCVLEYLLKQWLPDDSEVIAMDYNSFFIKNAKKYFPELRPILFDFSRDDLNQLKTITEKQFEIAVFFGSAYAMDDTTFVKQFRALREIGIKNIIDFHAGYIPLKRMPIILYSKIKWTILGALDKKAEKSRGIFHGYERSRSELRRLYKAAGLKIVEELSAGGYEYIAVLK
jgi:ubiquinone/menaquinone biosynthesis C-methylase UbiE